MENPLKDFFQEKIIKPLTNVTNRIFSTVGKIIGNIISAPFKAVEYIFAGTIGGKTPDELKDERQQKKDAERNSKLTDKLGKAQDSLKAASSRFGRIFSFLGGSGEADVAVDENGNPIEKKGFFNRLRRRGAAGGATTSTSIQPVPELLVHHPMPLVEPPLEALQVALLGVLEESVGGFLNVAPMDDSLVEVTMRILMRPLLGQVQAPNLVRHMVTEVLMSVNA